LAEGYPLSWDAKFDTAPDAVDDDPVDGMSDGRRVRGLLKKNGFLPEVEGDADPGLSLVGVPANGMIIRSPMFFIPPCGEGEDCLE